MTSFTKLDAADRTSTERFLGEIRQIVGSPHVFTDSAQTAQYRQGFRFGEGKVLAVVKPGSLLEQWKVVQACVNSNKIVIMQAANTGLTGGSTPDGDDYDREVVLINTMRMREVRVIEGGRQVICFPGSTLDQLEKVLKPMGREPHSVIGSSCIGASVFGGVCNNSGGSLIQRGPAYTEMALYAQVDASGRLVLKNHLGVNLGDDPEDILRRLDEGQYGETDIRSASARCSDHDYSQHVRQVDASTPARFNADQQRLYEASGSAGKLIVFAVRLDTFPIERDTAVFYIGTNDTKDLTEIRRHLLTNLEQLPIAAEYIHKDAYDVAEVYGKDTFLMIHHLGTQNLPKLFRFKSQCDTFFNRFSWLPTNLADRVLQGVSKLFPKHLPPRMTEYRNRFDHYLILKTGQGSTEATQTFLKNFFACKDGSFFRCSPDEASKAFLHRFAVAGAAVRYRAIHDDTVEDIVALDVALARNDRDWLETLPPEIERSLLIKLYYGHFFCHVFHQDYVVKKGVDCLKIEHQMWDLLDGRGAEYPAEHNVGHLYEAKPALREFYQALDPTNTLNPGIGKTSKCKHWAGS